jgi:hypothetical protein
LKPAEDEGGPNFNLPENSYPQLEENLTSQSLHQPPKRLANAITALSLMRYKSSMTFRTKEYELYQYLIDLN